MDSLSSRVAGIEFPIVKRGYDAESVDGHLESIATEVAILEEELAVANAKAAQLEARLRRTGDADTVVQTAFLAAAEAKAKLLQEAEARGDEIVAAAEARAAAIVADAGGTPVVESDQASLDAARAKAKEIEADAIRLLEDAKREAESIVAHARAELQAAGDDPTEAIVERTDAAREELHRIMWLLKTVKQAIHTGLVAAAEEAPELQLIIDDAVELADIQVRSAERT